MILFNDPTIAGCEVEYVLEVIKRKALSGDHHYTGECSAWLEKRTKASRVLLTTSCTHALEMAALLVDIKEGDEVIMPSYTFPSTANAFVLRGARVVFVDIRPDTMNIDENLIEEAITDRTRAIVPVHYGGVAAQMDKIMEIAARRSLHVIEDSAQAYMGTYKGRMLGSFGLFGTYSFHESKNYQCGEGGALVINDPSFIPRAEVIREKGTDRASFFRGEVAKYCWQDVGSSYLPSDINAAFLFAQLEKDIEINLDRVSSWNRYYSNLSPLEKAGNIELARVPDECVHNAHLFFVKTHDLKERDELMSFLKEREISAPFHYVPLHKSPAGEKYCRFHGTDLYTTKESERLLRLPIFYKLSADDVDIVCEAVSAFYKTK